MDEQLAAMKRVARTLSSSFAFGYYDVDDIEQECYVLALEALPRYDKTKSSLYTFLLTHVRNRLLNLRRDKMGRQCPCLTCKNLECKLEDKEECRRWRIWVQRSEAKKNLLEITSGKLEENRVASTEQQVDEAEIWQIIDNKLPFKYREIYCMVRDGAKVSNADYKMLVEKLREIING